MPYPPTVTEIIQLYGSWNAALEAAGLEPCPGDIALNDEGEGAVLIYPISKRGKVWCWCQQGEGVTRDRGTLIVSRSALANVRQRARAARLEVDEGKRT